MTALEEWARSVTLPEGGILPNPTVQLRALAKAILTDSTNVEEQGENDAKNCKCGGNLDERRELLDELIEWVHRESQKKSQRVDWHKSNSSAGSVFYAEGGDDAFREVIEHLQQLKDRDASESFGLTASATVAGRLRLAGEDSRNASASESFPVTPKQPVRIELTAEWVEGQGITYSASNKDKLPEGAYAAGDTSLHELSKTVGEGMKLMFDTDEDVPIEWVFGEGFDVSQDGKVGTVNIAKQPPEGLPEYVYAVVGVSKLGYYLACLEESMNDALHHSQGGEIVKAIYRIPTKYAQKMKVIEAEPARLEVE